MIQMSIRSARRILTFPAIHPCESVAPSTLLTSLTDLAHAIRGYRSKVFSCNSLIGREAIRQVSNLLHFFNEIRALRSGLPDSFVLGLSELHLTLQKVLFLLEDCTRDGSRIWMLINSELVSGQFRVFIRSIAMSLDVLPLWLLDVSVEVKELVELVARQARKARSEVDLEDKRVIDEVMSILSQFQDGANPEKSDLKEVLDYIGVKKWNDCRKEVKFLEAEMELEYSEGKRDLTLLSSLMALMSYSRCVLFDPIDNGIAQLVDLECKFQRDGVRCLNSDDFRCPISLEIMKDPVTLETGHTYDRSSILKWFRNGNQTCPKTGKKLTSTELVPNLTVKRLIQQYCVEHGLPVVVESIHKNRDVTRTLAAGSLAAEGAIKMVSCFLANRLQNGGCEDMNKAACEIRILSKTSVFNRSCLAEAGVIPYLLNLLLSEDAVCQENAIAALLNLSKHSRSKALIVENGGLVLIVDVLRRGLKMEAMQHAAAIIFYLASVEEYRKLIGESTNAIPALVEMVKEGSDRGKKNALVAIYGLLMYHGNRWRVLTAKIVPLLLSLLTSSEGEELITDSLAVLATLAENFDGAKEVLCNGALPQILGIFLSSYSRTAKEQCVSLLLALCINGGQDVVGALIKNASLMESLYSQLTEGTSKASKKASALIRILHEFYERNSSPSKTSVLSRERFIHVW
ncbi:hypothetical protein K2173_008256 [Erythroxylum novogranatense]|uniref:RING-type E3 ubiquitin transferase n=1 Tax=Erythroxylum novogranatense TaxID=1862640 RepID=A0AAV8U7H0_9ROSI|nr:hypothetical protein K2173_008256 [Erythroxylum novogranatense]